MRGKIISIALLISILASTFAFIGPAFAPSASLKAPTIVNPLMTPGQSFTADILVDDVTQMFKYEFTLHYDTSILTATSFAVPRVKGGPNFPFMEYTIDDAAGTVVAWATTANTTTSVSPYFAPLITTSAVLPVAFIGFTVDARGFSVLDLQDVHLYNRYLTEITPSMAIDGSFDNRFQGLIAAPTIQDEALIPGDIIMVEVSVDDVSKLWGFQFTLSYDTNVLTALDWEPMSIFTVRAPSVIDDAAGFARVAANSYFGDKIGLTTSNPVSIATIYFMLDAEGWSALTLSDEVLATTAGATLVVDVHQGAFASVNVADLIGRAAWPDVHKFKISAQPDAIDTLYARIGANMTGLPINVWAVFTVYDHDFGVVLGTLTSGTATIGPLGEAIVTADFDVNAWGTAPYKAFVVAQAFADVNGDGMADFAGLRLQNVNLVVTP